MHTYMFNAHSMSLHAHIGSLCFLLQKHIHTHTYANTFTSRFFFSFSLFITHFHILTRTNTLSLSMFIAEIWIPSSFYVISNRPSPFPGIGSTHCQEWDVGGFIGSPEHFIAALTFPIHLIFALISSLLSLFSLLLNPRMIIFFSGLKPRHAL